MEHVALNSRRFLVQTDDAFIMMPTHLTADVNLCASLALRHSLTPSDALSLGTVKCGRDQVRRQDRIVAGD